MPLSDRQRFILSAMYYVEKGVPNEEAIDRLRRRFGSLDIPAAAEILEAAAQALYAGEAINTAGEDQLLADYLALQERSGPIVAEASVIISAPGREDVHRTIRYDTLPETTTVGELAERMRQDAEMFEADYGSDGAVAAWTMRFVM